MEPLLSRHQWDSIICPSKVHRKNKCAILAQKCMLNHVSSFNTLHMCCSVTDICAVLAHVAVLSFATQPHVLKQHKSVYKIHTTAHV